MRVSACYRRRLASESCLRPIGQERAAAAGRRRRRRRKRVKGEQKLSRRRRRFRGSWNWNLVPEKQREEEEGEKASLGEAAAAAAAASELALARVWLACQRGDNSRGRTRTENERASKYVALYYSPPSKERAKYAPKLVNIIDGRE